MRVAIVVALIALALIVAGPVSAQSTYLGLSMEPTYLYCELTDAVPQLQTVFVLLTDTPGTLGVRFRVTQSVDCTLLYLQDQPDALYTAGNVVDGLTVCFGECITGTPYLLIATIQYFGFGTSAICSTIDIEPVPGSASIESVGCDGTLHSGYGWPMSVNDNGFQCPCYVVSAPPAPETTVVLDNDNFCAAVATEQSTWGAIKALYK